VLGYGLVWILEAAFSSAGLSVQMVGTTLWDSSGMCLCNECKPLPGQDSLVLLCFRASL
jgi:hypothetical protein